MSRLTPEERKRFRRAHRYIREALAGARDAYDRGQTLALDLDMRSVRYWRAMAWLYRRGMSHLDISRAGGWRAAARAAGVTWDVS